MTRAGRYWEHLAETLYAATIEKDGLRGRALIQHKPVRCRANRKTVVDAVLDRGQDLSVPVDESPRAPTAGYPQAILRGDNASVLEGTEAHRHRRSRE